MDNSKKEWTIMGVIALIIIIGYAIFISCKVMYWKHQDIAYEQYIAEDLRQAIIFNSTFATSEEEFLKKIENFPEADQIIAKAIYDIKPEVDPIRKEVRKDLKTREELIEILNSYPHDILSDNKTSLSTKGIYNIEQYLQTYNIKGNISGQEYVHLYEMFVPNGDSSQIAEFSNAINKYSIAASASVSAPNYSGTMKQLADIDQRIMANENLLNKTRATYNELISKNSVPLEYQNTITTNGIKTVADYLTSI